MYQKVKRRRSEEKMGNRVRRLAISRRVDLGLVGIFRRLKGLDDVGYGKECDALREVFKKDKKVLEGF